jgi:hypothetical protein
MEILITRSYLTNKIFSMIWTDWMPALANMTDYAMALPEKERGAERVSPEMLSGISIKVFGKEISGSSYKVFGVRQL